jgi:hypothetical protein
VSSLCLVENKLEGKAFIHSFTPPFIHPSIHLEGQKTFQVPKDIGSVLRSFKAPYVAVILQATQLPQLCKKATILANSGTVSTLPNLSGYNYMHNNKPVRRLMQ